jgi:ribosome-binding factor A
MSKRLVKVEKELKRVLSKIILKEIESLPGLLLTVTRVKISPDLNHAKVWVSILPDEKAPEFIKIIKRKSSFIRYHLAQKIVLKRIPELKFFLDLSEQKAQRIEKLIDSLKEKD